MGVGPLNFTFGKGQRLFQLKNNIFNIATNAVGLTNLFFGGKVRFSLDDITPVYYGGLRDKIFNSDSAYGSYAIFGSEKIFNSTDDTLEHELHHLWQSRTMGNTYLANYSMQGLNAILMGGNFYSDLNYYEQISYFHEWFKRNK